MNSTTFRSEKSPAKKRIQRASKAALLGLLNLTFLPVIAFIWLLFISKTVDKGEIDDYHVRLALKINILAGVILLAVSGLILIFGGVDSVYTWVYIIVYFTFVHSVFILSATWAMVVAWSGNKLQRLKL